MSEVSQSAPTSAVDDENETVGEALTEPALGNDAAQPTPPAPVESAEVTPAVEGPMDDNAGVSEASTVPGAPAGIPESAAVIEGSVDVELLDVPAQAVAAEVGAPAEASTPDEGPASEEASAPAEASATEEAPATAEAPLVVESIVEAVALVATDAETDAPATESTAEGESAAAPADDSAAAEGEGEVDGEGKRVVRTLAVGQEVLGTVKRIADFGAFVDIGVGRDGLVHISELSVKRVGKVSDLLTEGQQVPMWIKKLDRERNRISLTMISPDTKTLRDVSQGDIVNGTVTRILPYGAFVDIGVGRDALLHVREMGERYIAKPEEVVTVGEQIEVRIIEVQRRRGRIDLSIKGLRPEPEVEGAHAQQGDSAAGDQSAGSVVAQDEAAPEPVDQFADMEMPSAMELALRKAMDQSGVELKISKKKDKQRAEQKRQQQEEIYERTLKQGK
jgi:predicted RNA-binding protein with RPS1 domain